LAPLAKRISFAFIYGSIARGEELATSDVDLMVVGDAGLSDLAIPLRRVREKLGREVNPTVYSLDEFTRKASQGQHFIRSVLDKPRLFVVGTPNDMERAVGPRTRRAAGG
jgi:predicted nucleotidyltransferase